MRIPDGKIEGVASEEVTRYSLCYLHYEPQNRRIWASDGKMYAIVPVEPEDGDTPGAIEPDQIKEGRKRARKMGKHVTVRIGVNGEVQYADGVKAPRPTADETNPPPNIDAVRPKYDKECTVALDAEKLYELAKALKDGKDLRVRLWIKGDKCIMVKSYQDTGAEGGLMPLTK